MLLVLVAVSVGFYFVFIKSHGPGPEVQETPWGFRPKVGDVAPDFTLPTLSGNSVRLTDYRGKVVFLNFWATWCPPCRAEMPSMESLYQSLKTREFEILAVSLDIQGVDIVQSFVAEYALTFPVLLDPDNRTNRLYGLTGIPETFIIGKDGVILLKIIGAQDWMGKEWINYFDRITKQNSLLQ